MDVASAEQVDDLAERARADRFHREVHRRRFRGRRGALRRLLGGYLGRDPRRIEFDLGDHGKPELVEGAGLAFNLTHTGDHFLIAVARGRALGVDLEEHRLRTEVDRMAHQVLAPGELAVFEQLPESERRTAFFRSWTRKEAVLKATGEGFSMDPRTLDLGLDERPRERLWRPVPEGRWSELHACDLELPAALRAETPALSACLAAGGDGWRPVGFPLRFEA